MFVDFIWRWQPVICFNFSSLVLVSGVIELQGRSERDREHERMCSHFGAYGVGRHFARGEVVDLLFFFGMLPAGA
uniref:Putative secreted protein n=1 Tax=Anopheles darlingi TaxID=43151 RepID=A0A2M4DRI9_ANODA